MLSHDGLGFLGPKHGMIEPAGAAYYSRRSGARWHNHVGAPQGGGHTQLPRSIGKHLGWSLGESVAVARPTHPRRSAAAAAAPHILKAAHITRDDVGHADGRRDAVVLQESLEILDSPSFGGRFDARRLVLGRQPTRRPKHQKNSKFKPPHLRHIHLVLGPRPLSRFYFYFYFSFSSSAAVVTSDIPMWSTPRSVDPPAVGDILHRLPLGARR